VSARRFRRYFSWTESTSLQGVQIPGPAGYNPANICFKDSSCSHFLCNSVKKAMDLPSSFGEPVSNRTSSKYAERLDTCHCQWRQCRTESNRSHNLRGCRVILHKIRHAFRFSAFGSS
jgi:hypothetical protein